MGIPQTAWRQEVARFVTSLKSPYLFVDRKTLVGCELSGVCRLMAADSRGVFRSTACPNCYAARILSGRRFLPLRRKLEALSREPEVDLDRFEADLEALEEFFVRKGRKLIFLRAYSFSDFSGKKGEVEAFLLARKFFPVLIMTKVMHQLHRDVLVSLFNQPGVYLSLSLNSSFGPGYVQGLQDLIRQHHAVNTQLSWTFLAGEPYRNLGAFQVYHTVRPDRDGLAQVVGRHLVCGVIDEDGKPTIHGVCDRCGYCFRSYLTHQAARQERADRDAMRHGQDMGSHGAALEASGQGTGS